MSGGYSLYGRMVRLQPRRPVICQPGVMKRSGLRKHVTCHHGDSQREGELFPHGTPPTLGGLPPPIIVPSIPRHRDPRYESSTARTNVSTRLILRIPTTAKPRTANALKLPATSHTSEQRRFILHHVDGGEAKADARLQAHANRSASRRQRESHRRQRHDMVNSHISLTLLTTVILTR
nr:hypothetical protein CFP56_28805 [Quercus suber]